jgi:hypothetical protein
MAPVKKLKGVNTSGSEAHLKWYWFLDGETVLNFADCCCLSVDEHW